MCVLYLVYIKSLLFDHLNHMITKQALKRNSVEFEGTRRFDSSIVCPSIIDIQTFHRKALLYPLCKGMQEKLEGED